MNTKHLKISILSISLLTVLAGAAASSGLSYIQEYFSNADPLLIKMIVSTPALFIVITAFFLGKLRTVISDRTLVLVGAILYVVGGCGAGFMPSIYLILVFRALLGISVGILMPLSTALLTLHFLPDEQEQLMGYSSAMNNLGGVIAAPLSGLFASLNWRLTFAVYILGLFVFILNFISLPKTSPAGKNSSAGAIQFTDFKKIIPCMTAIFLSMVVYYTLPSNFALTFRDADLFSSSLAGIFLCVQTVASMLIGLILNTILSVCKEKAKYLSALMYIIGFIFLLYMQNAYFMILGLIAVGIATGIITPMLNSQIPQILEKEKAAFAMSYMSMALCLGQFFSPIIIECGRKLLHNCSPYMVAAAIAVILFFMYVKIPIRVNEETA